MKYYRRRVALFVVFMLAFQPFAAGFAGCMHGEESGHAGHGMQQTDVEHAKHRQSTMDTDAKDQKAGCLLDCKCPGMCLHACHAPSLVGSINIIMPNTFEDRYLLTHGISSPGYTFQLLRPPSIA